MPSLHIRPATCADAELVFELICELAVYEKLRHEVVATAATIRETVFGPGSCTEVLIAEWNGEPAGFAIFFATYSTFLGRQGIYLEDIYVREALRGRGIGKRLLVEVARMAVERNCGRLEWSVLDWNKPAIDFYESLGAEAQSEWIRYRLGAEEMRALARNIESKSTE